MFKYSKYGGRLYELHEVMDWAAASCNHLQKDHGDRFKLVNVTYSSEYYSYDESLYYTAVIFYELLPEPPVEKGKDSFV